MSRWFVVAVGLVVAASVSVLILGAGGPRDVPKPGEIITGRDLGFRVRAVGGGEVVGTFVVRVNGGWVPAELPEPPPVIPARP